MKMKFPCTIRPQSIQPLSDKTMMIKSVTALTLLLGISGMAAHSTPTHAAGGLENAALACFVDTYAYDQLVNGSCASGWKPWTAHNPTTAVFETTGYTKDPARYSYAWSGSRWRGEVDPPFTVPCGNSASCNISIAVGETLSVSATITDNQTGGVKTVSATAEFVDAYH